MKATSTFKNKSGDQNMDSLIMLIIVIVIVGVIFAWQHDKKCLEKSSSLVREAIVEVEELKKKLFARRHEWVKEMVASKVSKESFSIIFMFDCYRDSDMFDMELSDTKKRAVFYCKNIEDFNAIVDVSQLPIDWVVYYEPRRGLSAYSDFTRQIILQQPKVRTLRLSCGCNRNDHDGRRYGGIGGLNCSCSRESGADLMELKNCWLQDRDPSQDHLSKMKNLFNNRDNFIQDVRRLRFSVSE